MIRLKPSHALSTRPGASRLITISAFAAACVAMFVIPWFFPRNQPVLGESYALGFNNRLAVVGLCVVIIAAAMARWFSPTAAEDARETLAWFAGDGWQAIRSASKLEYAIDPLPVSIPVLMREMGNSPRGVSEGGAQPRP
jgi:hypothetical protein